MILSKLNRKWFSVAGSSIPCLAICASSALFFSIRAASPYMEHAHFAEDDIGQTLSCCSAPLFVLHLLFSSPKNLSSANEQETWAIILGELIAVALLLVFQSISTLVASSQPGESKLDRFVRALGISGFICLGTRGHVDCSSAFPGKSVMEIFKGQKVFRPTNLSLPHASSQI